MPSAFCIFSDLLYEIRRTDVVVTRVVDTASSGFGWENGNRDAEIVTNLL